MKEAKEIFELYMMMRKLGISQEEISDPLAVFAFDLKEDAEPTPEQRCEVLRMASGYGLSLLQPRTDNCGIRRILN